jgi:hypothetical protein
VVHAHGPADRRASDEHNADFNVCLSIASVGSDLLQQVYHINDMSFAAEGRFAEFRTSTL